MTIQKCFQSLPVLWMLLTAPLTMAQECELDRPVVFAGLDWDSNRVHTAIARYILENGYGCKTDRIPGSTIPMITGLGRGDLDIMMEIWKENIPEAWHKALTAGKVVELDVNFPDAVQGWYVPRYVIEGDPERGIEPMAPDLHSVFDLPRYTALFRDPEEPDKGRFYNCILGWACEVFNTKKLKAYGLDDHYTNFRPGTGEALAAAIVSAYKRGRPILAYYWGPTWVLGVYDLVMLEEPEYNPKDWQRFQESDSPAIATAYPKVEVFIGVNREFHDSAPQLIAFLNNYQTSNALISELLAYMEENNATEEAAAVHFLKARPETWTAWVPEEVAQQVEASLQ